MIYYRYPVNKIAITSDYGYRTSPYSGFHSGLDLGWYDYKGEEVLSIGNGEVIEKGYTSVLGHYISIKHDESDKSTYMHLSSASTLNIGDIVSTGTVIGYMGETGNATGVHLHVEVTRNNESIDPKTILYVYENQIVSENTMSNYKLLYYSEVKIKPTIRNENNNQVLVNVNLLQIRKGPGLSYETYSDYAQNGGIYDYYEVIFADGYDWYKVGDSAYIASEGTYLTIYENKKSISNDDLKLEIKNLKVVVSNKENEIVKLKEIITNLQKIAIMGDTYKFKYNVPKSEKYKISLNKGEVLIIK